MSAVVVAGGGCTRDVVVDVARRAAVVRCVPRAGVAPGTAAVGDDQCEVVRRVPHAAHNLGQPHAGRVHIEPAWWTAVEEGARDASPTADVARDGCVATGLDEHERVYVELRRGEGLRVTGARLMDAEVAAGTAAVCSAGEVLPAHIAAERPTVVALHELVAWMGEMANDGVLVLRHLLLLLVSKDGGKHVRCVPL